MTRGAVWSGRLYQGICLTQDADCVPPQKSIQYRDVQMLQRLWLLFALPRDIMTKSNTAKVMIGNCQSLSVIPCVSSELFKDVLRHSAFNQSGPVDITEAYFRPQDELLLVLL